MGQRSMTKNVLSNLSSILYEFPKKCATLKQEFLPDGLCDLKQWKEYLQQGKAVTGRQRLKIPGVMVCHKAATTKCSVTLVTYRSPLGSLGDPIVKTQVLSVNCSTLACNTGSFFPTFKDKQRLT